MPIGTVFAAFGLLSRQYYLSSSLMCLAWGDVVSRSVMQVLIEIVEECAVIRWLCEVRVNLTLKTKKKSNNRHTS